MVPRKSNGFLHPASTIKSKVMNTKIGKIVGALGTIKEIFVTEVTKADSQHRWDGPTLIFSLVDIPRNLKYVGYMG